MIRPIPVLRWSRLDPLAECCKEVRKPHIRLFIAKPAASVEGILRVAQKELRRRHDKSSTGRERLAQGRLREARPPGADGGSDEGNRLARFDTLDRLETRLGSSRYYFDSTLTETDIRLFPTLVRFDAIYYILFKCSRRRLVDHPHLWAYARDLYGTGNIAETVDFEAMREASYLADADAAHGHLPSDSYR